MADVMNVVNKVLTWLVPIMYLLIGSLKLYPINPVIYKELLGKFTEYVHITPTALLGLYVPSPRTYMAFVGSLEVACALVLLFGSISLRTMGSAVLVAIMIGACVTHMLVYDFAGLPSPIFFLLLSFQLFRYTFTLCLVESSEKRTEKKTN